MSNLRYPSFLSVDEINSTNLSIVLKERDPLAYLRDVYITDKNLFFDLIDELKLRGIAIQSEKPNDFLPDEVIEGPRLLVKESGTKFGQINFDLLGLNLFVERFHVTDDTFFNNIPLQGFQQLNKALELQIISDVFEEAGMQISRTELHTAEDTQAERDGEKEDNRSIRDVFSDSKFLSFLRYSAQNQLVVISDITDEHIEGYRHFYGVGVKKYSDFLEKWEAVKSGQSEPDSESTNTTQESSIGFQYALPIEDVFGAPAFVTFLDFCKEHNVNYVTDLKRSTIAAYSQMKGVGRKKVELVEQQIQEQLAKEEEYYQALNQPVSSIPIYSAIEKMSIGELLEKIEPALRTNISDEEANCDVSHIDELPEDIRRPIVEELISIHPINAVADELKKTVSARDLDVLLLRSDPAETLETIGTSIGVTRERARQILSKAIRKLIVQAEHLKVAKLFTLLANDRFGVSEQFLKKELEPENHFIFTILREMNESICYIPRLKLFLTDDEASLLDELVNKLDDLPPVLTIEDFQSYVKELLEDRVSSQEEEDLQNYLLALSNMRKYGSYISRHAIQLVKKLEIIFRDHLDEPLLLNEEGKATIDQLSQELFGSPTNNSLRALQGRVRDVEKVILVDNLTFQWMDESVLEDEVFEEIEQFINLRLSEQTHINAEAIFEEFEERVTRLGIHNKLHLYSLIKYLFDDQYTIGKGNTLNIYKKGIELYSLDDKIEKTLRNATKDYTLDELATKLDYRKATIDLMISKSSKYLNWENDVVRLTSSLGMTEEDAAKLAKFVEQHMPDGYSTTFKLLQECQFDEDMSRLLNRYGIRSEYVLGSVIKKFVPSIKGHSVFLHREDSQIQSFEEAVRQAFTGETTRAEISDFIREHGYSSAMEYQMLHQLMKRRDFVLIDDDQLHNRSTLEVSEEVWEAVRAYLDQELEGKDYVVISELIGFRRKLPRLAHRWRPRLLHTLAIELGYRHIKSVDDYRYDQLIIVSEQSPIQSFDEIVYKELVENYEGPLHETEVAKHLKGLGLLWSDERLPFELMNSELFSIDEFGRISLTEEIAHGVK